MAEQTLTQQMQAMGRRVGALEEEQSTPDSISRIVKAYGRLRITVTMRWSTYRFRTCSEDLPCSESLIL